MPGACRSPTGTCAVVSLVALGKETVWAAAVLDGVAAFARADTINGADAVGLD